MSAVTTKDEIIVKLHQLHAIPAVVQEVIASFWNANLESGLSGDALINHLPEALRDRLKISRERIEACMPEPGELDAGSIRIKVGICL